MVRLWRTRGCAMVMGALKEKCMAQWRAPYFFPYGAPKLLRDLAATVGDDHVYIINMTGRDRGR